MRYSYPHLLAFTLTVSIASATIFAGTDPQTQPAPDTSRQDFLKLIDRPHVAPDPIETSMTSPAADLLESHLTITTEPGQQVPALVFKSKTAQPGPLPVVIVLHGTGGRKEDELQLLEMLARAGMIAIAPDARYHGERCPEGKGTKTYFAQIVKAYTDGRSHPWLYDEVYDWMRLIDYLQTRSDIDPKRIGLIGISKGGMETYLTAAVDPRVSVAVPCISIQSFRWELDNDRWHGRISTLQRPFNAAAAQSGASPRDPAFLQHFYDRMVPGIAGEFDCPAMLKMIAPRPLLAISGEKDPLNPLPCAQLAADTATQAYAQAGVPDRFQFILEKGVAHQVTTPSKEAAVSWFKRWLSGQ